MKLLSITLLLVSAWVAQAQVSEHAVEGYWLNEDGSFVVQVYKSDKAYKGKIVWLKDSLDMYGEPLRDVLNDISHRRTKFVKGLDILNGFLYDGSGYWRSGTIYNYKTGNTYNAKMTINSEGNLVLTGYYGILWFLGKSKEWTKVENKTKYGLK